MGLDITAYGGLFEIDTSRQKKELVETMLDSGHWWQPHAVDWAEKEFPGRTKGEPQVVMDHVYGASQRYSFRAGSYSGYGEFRDFLARLAGWASARAWWDSDVREGPFFELVHFADNEGCIGSIAAGKLVSDFRAYEAKALAEADECRWFWHAYNNWRRAFEIASEGGAVDFH